MRVASSCRPGCGEALPKPTSATLELPPKALCAIASVASRRPAAAGLKRIVSAQLCPPDSRVPAAQSPAPVAAASSNSEACAPARPMAPRLSTPVPPLPTSRRSAAELLPTVCEKLSDGGDSVITGNVPVPVPPSDTVLSAAAPL